MDGQGIAAAIELGAAGVQMGTAFILCPESSASEQYRSQIKSELAQHTAITSAISGRPARGLVNKMYFTDKDLPNIPDYPIAYDAAKQLYQIASSQKCNDFAAHWAGQGAPLARELPAASLMRLLIKEWMEAQTACSP